MNLHEVHFALTNVGIWLTVVGRNGRNIGTHLWVVPEGQPPTEPQERPAWMANRSYAWTPRRFTWQPFDYMSLIQNRTIVPALCGRRTNSTNPRLGAGWFPYCESCRIEALRRGIMPLTYTEAQQLSTIPALLLQEQREWESAGRPTPWPPSPST